MGRNGFWSSAGASVSLMVAGVILVLALSSVVAFRGWPGLRDAPTAGSAVLGTAPAPATGASERATLGGAKSQRARNRKAARRSSPVKRAARRGATRPAPGRAPVRRKAPAVVAGARPSSDPAVATPPPPAAPAPPAPAPTPANPVGQVLEGVSGTAEKTDTQTGIGETVGEVLLDVRDLLP